MADPNPAVVDCLIVGAGPAGLTATTYLSRFQRSIAVVDAGASRARWIPTSHNCPGFPFGISGPDLLEKLRHQAESFGAVIEKGQIEKLDCDADGFIATGGGRTWRARKVLLATGIVDKVPEVEGIEGAIASGVIRLCAVCDGYEASDERIAVLGPIDSAIKHAAFLRTFSRRVSAIPTGTGAASAESAALATDSQIAVLGEFEGITCGEHCVVRTCDGKSHEFDTIYPVLGSEPKSGLAKQLGARVDEEDEIIVDSHQMTSVDGLYAIGDIVSALNQISVAVGHAAIAATEIHNRLPRNPRERQPTPAG